MSCGVEAASQQTYFIVSGSPCNTMLVGGDQNTILGILSPVGLMLLRSKLILLSPAPPSNTMLGVGDPNTRIGI